MSRASGVPLRVRLVAGFSAVMLVVLSAAGAFVYWRVQYALDRGLDRELDQAVATLAPLVAPDGAVSDTRAADATGQGWQTLTADGALVAHGGPAGATPLAGPALLARAARGPVTRDLGSFLPGSTDPLRLRVVRLGTATTLVVSVRRDRRDEALRELLLQLAVAGLGAMVLTAVVGERLAWSALLPVERYRRRAQEITGGALGVRLDVPARRDDEVTRLGHTLNDMLGELERSVERERRFVDEASHELRTPLTVLSSRLQLARRRPRTVAEHEAVLDELAVDVGRLAELAEQLLALGAAGSAAEGSCDLAAIVRALLATRAVLAEHVDAEIAEEPVPVAVAAGPATRLVGNLLDNARTHGRAPILVTVTNLETGTGGRWGRVSVADAGPGMSTDLLATATGRFTRGPESHSAPGAGLGLALAEAVVSAAGGQLRLCHDGRHSRYGAPVEVACEHDERMTVTILLPRQSGRRQVGRESVAP